MIEESKYQEAKEELKKFLHFISKRMINNKEEIKKFIEVSIPTKKTKKHDAEIQQIMLEIFDEVYDEFMQELASSQKKVEKPNETSKKSISETQNENSKIEVSEKVLESSRKLSRLIAEVNEHRKTESIRAKEFEDKLKNRGQDR